MNYSKQLKLDAIKLSDEIGYKEASIRLGVPLEKIRDWKYYYKNKDRIKIKHGVYREANRELCNQRSKNSIAKDPQAQRDRCSKNYYKDTHTHNQRVIKRKSERMLIDPMFNCKETARHRLYTETRDMAKGVLVKYSDVLGCTNEEFKQHMTPLLKTGWTFRNRSKIWDYDHIIPVALFDNHISTEEGQRRMSYYKNLRPLSMSENRQRNKLGPMLLKLGYYLNDQFELIDPQGNKINDPAKFIDEFYEKSK